MRQMLAEAVLLSLLGALAAIGLALLLILVLLALAPQNSPRLESISVDWRVPLFAAAAGLASVVIFGIVLAVRAARPDVMHIVRGEGHPASSASGQRLRNTVVIVEVTLSFVLLVGSGLMFRSLYQLQHIDPGYDPHHILTLLLARNWQLSQQAGRVELLSQIQSRLWALAGVENVTASVPFPLAGGSPPPMGVRTQQASTDLTGIFTVDFHGVLAGYFETLRTPVLAGRTIAEDDIARGGNVAVIDQLLANEAFPNESAGGKRIFLPFGEPPWVDVIRVVAHQRTDSLAEPGRREQIYFPDSFGGIGMSRYWAIRTAGNSAQYAAAISAAVAEFGKQFVISKVQPVEALVERDQAGTRFLFVLIAVFAAIAVMLAGAGLTTCYLLLCGNGLQRLGAAWPSAARRLKYSRWFLDTDCFSACWASWPACS